MLAKIGLNLIALKTFLPKAEMSAIEINSFAVQELQKNIKDIKIYPISIFDFNSSNKSDFVFIK